MKNKIVKNYNDIPLMMTANDIQNIGFSRTMAYQILNRNDVPVVIIGERKFVKKDSFFDWLGKQTTGGENVGNATNDL